MYYVLQYSKYIFLNVACVTIFEVLLLKCSLCYNIRNTSFTIVEESFLSVLQTITNTTTQLSVLPFLSFYFLCSVGGSQGRLLNVRFLRDVQIPIGSF